MRSSMVLEIKVAYPFLIFNLNISSIFRIMKSRKHIKGNDIFILKDIFKF